MKGTKTIEFSFVFRRPANADVVAAVPCPYCKAPIGTRCSTLVWGGAWSGGKRGGKSMSNLHHERYGKFMKIDELYAASPYKVNS